MNDKENQKKPNDGLPDVAEQIANKKSILFVTLALLAAVILGCYLHNKPKENVEKPVEESYSIQDASQSKAETVVGQTTQPANAEQSKENVQQKQEITTEQIAFIQEKQKELQQRLSAPLMVVSNSAAEKQPESVEAASAQDSDPNTRFMNRVSAQNAEVSTATTIGSLNAIIAEGSLIHATMESATNSDLPGYLRASVSEPVYSEDASRVLIPIGSRIIGQYKSGMLQGQARIFIVWTRLITPAGVSVNLGSQGTDSLGVAGIGADEIDRHFWQRFGTASLLSILGAGTANMGVNGADQQNSASTYREAVAGSFSQSASQSLQQEAMIAPTLKTYQGKPIMVFVARDLHFGGVASQSKPDINVF